MSVLQSTLGMLGTFMFGRTLTGLRGLGSTPSAFSGLMGLGAMPTNAQERLLDKALAKLLRDNAAQIRAFVGRFGAEEDLVQDAMESILMRARNDPRFAANPEAWVEKVITKNYLLKSIQNAWYGYARSKDAKARQELAQQLKRNEESGGRELDVEDLEHGPVAMEYRLKRRELPMLVKMLTRGLDRERSSQIEDLVDLGAKGMEEAAVRISNGTPPVEARRVAYTEQADLWNKKHRNAAPYASRNTAGDIQIDANGFQRDLLALVTQMRKIARGAGEGRLPSGVFLSEGRTRADVIDPDAQVWLELPSGRKLYVKPPLFVTKDMRSQKGKFSEEAADAYKKEQKAESKERKRQEKVGEALVKVMEKKAATASPGAGPTASPGAGPTASPDAGPMRPVDNTPVAPSFADKLMAIKAVDAAEADKADALAEKYNQQESNFPKASGVKGVSAFAGLCKVRKSAKRRR